jgi:hypothetical protein
MDLLNQKFDLQIFKFIEAFDVNLNLGCLFFEIIVLFFYFSRDNFFYKKRKINMICTADYQYN